MNDLAAAPKRVRLWRQRLETMERMFREGATRAEVGDALKVDNRRLIHLISKGRECLGRDFPGHGSKIEQAQMQRSTGRTMSRKRESRPAADANIKRCTHCHLILSADGECIDCPRDARTRAALLFRRGNNGGARLTLDPA
jgi:hypothetical protein